MTDRTLYFAVQTRLHRDTMGNIRTDFGYARYEAWIPFLTGVTRIVVVSRVAADVRDSGALVEGPGVAVMAIPYYRGPLSFVRKVLRLRKFLKENLTDEDALYGARIPNLLGSLVQRRARNLGASFVAQVVGDPEDVLNAGVAGRVGRLLSASARRAVARDVSRADAVIYVTRRTLQEKYPPSAAAPTLVRSNVELSSSSFSAAPRHYLSALSGAPIRLVTAGTHDQLYKGHDVLIDAVVILRQRGLDVRATIVGGGKHHDDLIERARASGVGAAIQFTGHLASAEEVRKHIVNADIFVMPSRTEGLPRVLIEAMAGGIACIGSRVGGIPELLNERSLFESGSAMGLAALVEELAHDPERMTWMSKQQWDEAKVIAESYSGTAILGPFLRSVEPASRLGR
ncbi:MAG: glycosyltransferase family 4 protein [Cryobacterium sp.]|nr:glycosyltransferase family 4 protein [Cryobacterium sp.]